MATKKKFDYDDHKALYNHAQERTHHPQPPIKQIDASVAPAEVTSYPEYPLAEFLLPSAFNMNVAALKNAFKSKEETVLDATSSRDFARLDRAKSIFHSSQLNLGIQNRSAAQKVTDQDEVVRKQKFHLLLLREELTERKRNPRSHPGLTPEQTRENREKEMAETARKASEEEIVSQRQKIRKADQIRNFDLQQQALCDRVRRVRAARATRPPSPATAGGGPAQCSTCVCHHRRVATVPPLRDLHAPGDSRGATALPGHG